MTEQLRYFHYSNIHSNLYDFLWSERQDHGGNLTIHSPQFFTLDDSQLLANAEGGNGGQIDIGFTQQFNVLGNSSIDASSTLGFDGRILVNEVPLNENLTVLPYTPHDSKPLGLPRCAIPLGLSTLHVYAYEILPSSPYHRRLLASLLSSEVVE